MKTQTHTDAQARVTISLPQALAEDVDVFWHAKRLGSRSEAIRVLIEAGLKTEGKRKRDNG